MRTTLAGLLAVLAVTAGGADGDEKSKPGAGERFFRISVPAPAATLKPGEAKDVTMNIRRKNFDEDITISFEKVPKGVALEPTRARIKRNQEELKITVKASEDAAPGDFTVKVIGGPTTGAAATLDMKISIEKN